MKYLHSHLIAGTLSTVRHLRRLPTRCRRHNGDWSQVHRLENGDWSLPSDAFAAINTIHDFLLCLDRGDHERFATLFTEEPEEGTCELVKFGAVARGQAELKDLCRTVHDNFKGCLHFEHTPVLRTCPSGRSDTIHSESYWSAVRGGQIISTGLHKDKLERRHSDGQWLFRERRIFHHWTLAGGYEQGDEGAGAWDRML